MTGTSPHTHTSFPDPPQGCPAPCPWLGAGANQASTLASLVMPESHGWQGMGLPVSTSQLRGSTRATASCHTWDRSVLVRAL